MEDENIKRELAEIKDILSRLLEIQKKEFDMKYGYFNNNNSKGSSVY